MTNNNESNALVLGIDTGGTYTDGVLLEYHSRRVLAAYKSLTTRRDFSIGIGNVIDGIDIADPTAIKMVSISTTLATNAIAEGKGKRVALFLIGYDPDLIATFKMAQQFATPHYTFFAGGHDVYGRQKTPLDLDAIVAKTAVIQNQVDAIAVSSYFSPLNPEHENRVYEAISSICDLPIVLGHQLSTKLGSVERATTAALNASLLTGLQEFVTAVRQAMTRRQIDAPLMAVRGDGTLMSDEFAARTPVETIHSGPAASAIGGRFLSRHDDALVIDIGGTTTDLALIQNGQVSVSEEGATVGGFKTAVQAANLLSIGLGGDSHIALNRERNLVIGPQRVVPLAYLASEYPQVGDKLKSALARAWSHISPDWVEFWFLLREPQDPRSLNGAREKELVALLKNGPLPLPEILERLGVLHVSQLGVDELLRREIIGKAGLTPTDLLHVDGRHTPWDAPASTLALNIFSQILSWDATDMTQFVWSQMTETITRAVVAFLSEKDLSPQSKMKDKFGQWMFQNSITATHPLLETTIRLRLPIIGIGAPAGIFLPAVARLLHTDLILPEHYHVANAVGAVAGSVMAVEEVLVYPRLSGNGLDVVGYYVQAGNGRQEFEDADEALQLAQTLGHDRALSAALRSGADNPQVSIEKLSDGMDSYRIRAKAIGNPRLTR